MNQSIKILVTGDFYGGNRTDDLIESEQYSKIFNDFLPIIQGSDIAVTNLESALTISGTKIPKTGPLIKASPKTAEALRFAGFNLVTLANNHIMDFGEEGLKDTFKELEKHEIAWLGAGKNLNEAQKPLYKDVKGYKLAFLNFAENEWSTTNGDEPGANPLNPIGNFYAIKDAAEKADLVFVIVHGGHEMYPLPSPRMKQTYRFFIDAGADAVIGHHPHVYSGYEVYKDKPVFYSLGNFVFDKPKNTNPLWHRGFAVQFNITRGKMNFSVVPYSQCEGHDGVKVLSSEQKDGFQNEISRLNDIVLDDNRLVLEFEKYCKKVALSYRYYLEPHTNRYLYFLQRKGLFPSLVHKKKRLYYENLMRCEAHRDVVQKTIRQ